MDYNSNYMYTSEAGSGDAGTNLAVAGAVFFFFIIFTLVIYAVYAWLLGRVFKKAGVPQWAAWVPIYSNWKLLEIGGQQGFWAVLSLIPIVNIVSLVFTYIAMYYVGKKLGKEDWFVLLAIFVPIVWLIWLAFDDSKWQGKKPPVAASTAAVSPTK